VSEREIRCKPGGTYAMAMAWNTQWREGELLSASHEIETILLLGVCGVCVVCGVKDSRGTLDSPINMSVVY